MLGTVTACQEATFTPGRDNWPPFSGTRADDWIDQAVSAVRGWAEAGAATHRPASRAKASIRARFRRMRAGIPSSSSVPAEYSSDL